MKHKFIPITGRNIASGVWQCVRCGLAVDESTAITANILQAPPTLIDPSERELIRNQILGRPTRPTLDDLRAENERADFPRQAPSQFNAVRAEAFAKQTFEGGATRTPLDEAPYLIPAAAVRALGRRLEKGLKHGENNWRTGERGFQKATISHLMKHLFDYLDNGNADDNNTDAIICGAAFLCDLEERFPFPGNNAIRRGVSAKPSEAQEDHGDLSNHERCS